MRHLGLWFLRWSGLKSSSTEPSGNLSMLQSDGRACRQVQPRDTGKQYRGVWRSLVRMWKEEGFRGFMRGNGINCIRIIPYSAVQFTTYEQLKKVGYNRVESPYWMTSSPVVYLEREETAGYPHSIGQRCSRWCYFCLFVLSDLFHGLAFVFFNAFFLFKFSLQAQHTH